MRTHPAFAGNSLHAVITGLLKVPVLLALVVIAGWAQPGHAQIQTLDDLDISKSKVGGPFELTGPGGSRVKLADFKGKVVMLAFGYTFCPDVCPTTLLEMARAKKKMGDKAAGVQGVFITVDPKRDSADRLAEYVRHFDSTFVGLTGTEKEIKSVGDKYMVRYRINKETKSAASYLVDHTTFMFLIDQKGKPRYVISYDQKTELLLEGLNRLLNE